MGLTTGNTFSVRLDNPTDTKQSVELFRQGYAPSELFATNTSRKSVYEFADWKNWYDAATNTLLANTRFQVLVSFGVIIDSGVLGIGDTIAMVQERMIAAWVSKPANGDVKVYLNSQSQFVVEVFGVMWGATGNIMSITAASTYSAIFLATSQSSNIVSPYTNVILLPQSVSYQELLATQTGSPMNVIAIDIDCDTATQFTNPITYKRIDANGQTAQRSALSVIDPYQFQVGHIVHVPVEGLLFDGNCQFDYTVDPFSVVKVTFRYVNAAESMLFQQALRQQIIDQYRAAQQDMLDLSSGLKKVLVP